MKWKISVLTAVLLLSGCALTRAQEIREINARPCDQQNLQRIWSWWRGYWWTTDIDCNSREHCKRKYKTDLWDSHQAMLARAPAMRAAGLCEAQYDEYGRWIRPDGSIDPLVTGSRAWLIREGRIE